MTFLETNSTDLIRMTGKRNTTVKMADVAKLAGVSVSSVSNVLNNRTSRMRPETHKRIIQSIEKLGYTPNLAARQLKTGHSQMIGLIVPSIAHPFFGDFARYVEEAALHHGYQVLLGNSGRYHDREQKHIEQLWGAGVRGIIVGTSLSNLAHLSDLIKLGLHVVAFDRPSLKDDSYAIDSVYVDNIHLMRLLVKHLTGLGHSRIGFITGPVKTNSRRARLNGFKTCMKDAGLQVDDELIWEAKAKNFGDVSTVKLGREGAHQLFSLKNPPTAIITVNDMYAFGVYAGARDLGVKIPKDVSVVGVDNLTLGEVVEPPLTTAEQPLEEMAKLAVEKLMERLQEQSTGSQMKCELKAKLIVRESTAVCGIR